MKGMQTIDNAKKTKHSQTEPTRTTVCGGGGRGEEGRVGGRVKKGHGGRERGREGGKEGGREGGRGRGSYVHILYKENSAVHSLSIENIQELKN